MKVLIVTGIFPPDIGGPATYVPLMACQFCQKGIEVHVLTLSNSIKSDDNAYPFVITRLMRNRSKLFRVPHLISEIVRLGRSADLLFVHDLGFEANIANKFLRKPLVLKVVSDWAWERAKIANLIQDTRDEFQTNRYGWKIELWRWIQRGYVRSANLVITPSNYLRSIIARWGVPDRRIRVIPNAIEGLYRIQRLENRKGKTEREEKTAVTVGRLVNLKRIDGIISAVAHLDNVQLVVIGDGPERKNLGELVASLDITTKVQFTGVLNHDLVMEYLTNAGLFVLNSSDETFPHVLLEAMICGTPVIATNVGGVSEIISDEIDGFLIDPNDSSQLLRAMQRILNDAQLADRMRQNAYAKVEMFSVSKMVEATVQVLRDVLKGRI